MKVKTTLEAADGRIEAEVEYEGNAEGTGYLRIIKKHQDAIMGGAIKHYLKLPPDKRIEVELRAMGGGRIAVKPWGRRDKPGQSKQEPWVPPTYGRAA